jgi:hypothetical protein
MSWGLANRTHFVEYDATAALGQLPRGLAASQTSSHDVSRANVMNRHPLTIATRPVGAGLALLDQRARTDQILAMGPERRTRLISRRVRVGFTWMILGSAAGCFGSMPEPADVSAEKEWVRTTCDPETPLSERWPRYTIGRVSIAVPPEYRLGSDLPHSKAFRSGTAEMFIRLERDTREGFNVYYGPGTASCDFEYGGHPAHTWAWEGRGQYRSRTDFRGLNDPDLRPLVVVTIRTTRLRDAVLLRRTLHTIQVLP